MAIIRLMKPLRLSLVTRLLDSEKKIRLDSQLWMDQETFCTKAADKIRILSSRVCSRNCQAQGPENLLTRFGRDGGDGWPMGGDPDPSLSPHPGGGGMERREGEGRRERNICLSEQSCC